MIKLYLQQLKHIGLSVFIAGCSVKQLQDQVSVPDLSGPILDQVTMNSQNGASCQHTETTLNCVKVVEIYDGDTIFIDIPDAPPPFGKRLGVRFADIDTPELRTRDACEKSKAQEARSVLKSLIYNAKRIDIVNVEKDKYFRILGSVLVDGKPVAQELTRRNLGYPYQGKKKLPRNWCDTD